MSAPPLFEVGAREQATALECEERDGRPVLRVREGTRVTPGLVQAFNDVLGEPGTGQVPGSPPHC